MRRGGKGGSRERSTSARTGSRTPSLNPSLAGTLAVLFLRGGEVTVILLWAVDRIGRRDIRIVELLQRRHAFVGRVVIPGRRNRRHLVARFFLQNIEGDDQAGSADRGGVADGDPGQPILLVVDQLLDEAVVVGAHERHKWLLCGL